MTLKPHEIKPIFTGAGAQELVDYWLWTPEAVAIITKFLEEKADEKAQGRASHDPD